MSVPTGNAVGEFERISHEEVVFLVISSIIHYTSIRV